MPNIYPIQDDFSAGEISPKMRGKTQSPDYRSGLAYCENFEVTPQGSLEMRGGTRYITTIDEDGDSPTSLHTFTRGINKDVAVVVGANKVRLFDTSGQLTFDAPDGTNLITNPDFVAGLDDWSQFRSNTSRAFISSVPFVGVELKLTESFGNRWQENDRAVVEQVVTVAAGDEHELNFTITFGEDREDPFGNTDQVCNVLVFDVGDEANPLAEFDLTVGESGWPSDRFLPNPWPISRNFTPQTSQIIVRFTIKIINTGGGRADPFTFWYTANQITLENLDFVTSAVEFDTPTDWIGKFPLIQTAMDAGIGQLYFTVLGGTMHVLTYNKGGIPDWTFEQFTPLLPAPPAFPPWGQNNDPSCCAIHQGRLWLAAPPDNPSTIYASRTFDYTDFETGSNPSDPLEFTLASSGAIQWLDGLKLLLVGTDLGEVIGRSSGPSITPTDFDFPLEQTWGSARVQPADMGRKVAFVATDNRKLRSLYDGGDSANSYEAGDPSITADQLFRSDIISVDYARTPNYRIQCLKQDGTIAECTHFDPIQINAWFRTNLGDPVKNLTTANDLSGTSTWMIVKRFDETRNPFLSLELKFAANQSTFNTDSWVITNADGEGLVTGLDHLNGYECDILLVTENNNERLLTLHPRLTPVNGELQLDSYSAGRQVVVGIPYKAAFETLPIEGSNQQGTAQVQRRRYNEVFLRLYESSIPKINGERPPVREPATLLNNSQTIMSGDTALHTVGWNDAVIRIEQDLPLPTNISAIFGKVKGSSV